MLLRGARRSIHILQTAVIRRSRSRYYDEYVLIASTQGRPPRALPRAPLTPDRVRMIATKNYSYVVPGSVVVVLICQ